MSWAHGKCSLTQPKLIIVLPTHIITSVTKIFVLQTVKFLFFCYFYIYKKSECTNSNFVQCIWFVQPAWFISFFFFASFVCAFLSFLLNIYYLYVHIQLHRLNKFLQYFNNYLTICTVYWPFFCFFF